MSVRVPVAALIGLVVVLGLVTGIESVGDVMYPTPADLDLTDSEQLRRYVETLPLGAFLVILTAWVTSTFAGGLVAALVARTYPYVVAGFIGLVVFVASASHLSSIPHPIWFARAALIAVPLAAWAAGAVAARIARGRVPQG